MKHDIFEEAISWTLVLIVLGMLSQCAMAGDLQRWTVGTYTLPYTYNGVPGLTRPWAPGEREQWERETKERLDREWREGVESYWRDNPRERVQPPTSPTRQPSMLCRPLNGGAQCVGVPGLWT